MAKRNSPTTEQDRERLRVKDGCWRIHTHDIYRGNAADLIAAGLVRPEQLPGTEGMPSTAATFYDGQRQKEIISNCKTAMAKADGGFQRALDRIQQSASEVGHV